MTRQEKLERAYQQMAEHTLPECKSCPVPLSCCESFYCGVAKLYAKERYDVDLKETGHPTLPFMGENGCIVPPHMRPMCTLHTCRINSLGFKPGDLKWTKRYFELRRKIERLETVVYKEKP